MATSTRNTRYVTPKGTLIYPYLSTPDTKFSTHGDYKAEIELPEDAMLFDAKGKPQGTILDFLQQSLEDSVEKFAEIHNGKKKKGKAIEVEEAQDAPFYCNDGKLFVKFKLKAYVEPAEGEAFTQAPLLFDAKGKKFSPPKNPWNGTTAKISFECVPYYNAKDAEAGITLRLKAAQVINPVFGGEADGEDYGFGEEEGFDSSTDDMPEGKADGFDEEDDNDTTGQDVQADGQEEGDDDF